jgi:hypothetical protein
MSDTTKDLLNTLDKTELEALINLNNDIKENSGDEDKNKQKYTKIIQKKFDESKISKDNNEKIIKINLIAIIYKRGADYEFKFKIIKNNNEMGISNFINENSIYVYHRISTNTYKSKCNNFNQIFNDNNKYNLFLNNIKRTPQNILYTLSYIFENITYNIVLSIPIIIILTDKNKLILINYSEENSISTNTDTNTDIDITLLLIISKRLLTTITKYLKDNFENELDELVIIYNDDNIINNIGVNSNDKKYRKSNNIDSIINNVRPSVASQIVEAL